ncbi:MAG: glucose-6-phosphate isomerase [Bacteroidales bacterium]
MINLKFEYHYLKDFKHLDDIGSIEDEVISKAEELLSRNGSGSDYLGWIDLPENISDELISDIEQTAEKIRKQSDVVVVIGIGGSYVGARAIIEALKPEYSMPFYKGNKPVILYAGNNLSSGYHKHIIDYVSDKDFSVVVISKSGTTTEPAIAFRIFRDILEKKYGTEGASDRIVAITDKSKGALKTFCNKRNIKTFVIPDDVGGRYSVLTPVGLLPVAIAELDIRKLLHGAKQMQKACTNNADFIDHPVIEYVAVRNILYRLGKQIEILVSYNPEMRYFVEWWKQLFGESEGKQGEGIYPAGVDFTTDLHSLGQYIQDGQRIIFETIIDVENPKSKVYIPSDEDNLDNMDFVSGKNLNDINKMAMLGSLYAHIDGGVPVVRVVLPELNEETMGELIYFFEFACGVSGYVLGVNPFDQPGVEAYKRNMYALLDKPGYEEEGMRLRSRME